MLGICYSHSDAVTTCSNLNVVFPTASLLDTVVPLAEICISCLSNQAKTARSQHMPRSGSLFKLQPFPWRFLSKSRKCKLKDVHESTPTHFILFSSLQAFLQPRQDVPYVKKEEKRKFLWGEINKPKKYKSVVNSLASALSMPVAVCFQGNGSSEGHTRLYKPEPVSYSC